MSPFGNLKIWQPLSMLYYYYLFDLELTFFRIFLCNSFEFSIVLSYFLGNLVLGPALQTFGLFPYRQILKLYDG